MILLPRDTTNMDRCTMYRDLIRFFLSAGVSRDFSMELIRLSVACLAFTFTFSAADIFTVFRILIP